MSRHSCCVVGAGAWGTSLAHHLAAQGDVTLWCRRHEIAEQIKNEQTSPYLPGVTLCTSIRPVCRLDEALSGCDGAILAVPTQVLRALLIANRDAPWPDGVLTLANKGIELATLALPLDIVGDSLGSSIGKRTAVISGPSFAVELAQGHPTGLVAAAHEMEVARFVQRTLSFGSLRVYTSDDPTGVELAAGLKNVVAIAAGMCDGLGFGSNGLAALITRALAEVARLGVAMGARRETFMGLAGLGDLVLTCTGSLSRNRRVGQLLTEGLSLGEIRSSTSQVAEGIDTCRAARALSARYAVEMPIIEQVHEVLFAGKSPRSALAELLARPLRAEPEGDTP